MKLLIVNGIRIRNTTSEQPNVVLIRYVGISLVLFSGLVSGLLGVLIINEEKISYGEIRNDAFTELVRGVDGTEVSDHQVGSPVSLDESVVFPPASLVGDAWTDLFHRTSS